MQLKWDYAKVTYSLTVPYEAVAAALIATVAPAYAEGGVRMTLYQDGQHVALQSGSTSAFVDVPTEEPAEFVLEIRMQLMATNYSVTVLRSTVTSLYEYQYPDPGEQVPPEGTLVG